MHLDGGARNGTDAQDLQRGSGGDLLALFYGAAFARGDFPSLHGDSGSEAGPMRGALLGDHTVGRPQPVSLQRFLQERLPVAQLAGIDLRGVEDLVQGPQYEIPVYEVTSPYYGFDSVGDDGVVYHGTLDDLLYPLAPTHGGQERLPHQVGP